MSNQTKNNQSYSDLAGQNEDSKTENEVNLHDQENQQFREYPQRIWTLIGYSLICCAFQGTSLVFGSISAQVADIYEIKPIVVNMNQLILNFLALPLSFPVGFMLEKIGLRPSLRISALLVLVAAWLRVLVNYNYYFVLLGHILLGIGQPIANNSITTVSLVWFRAEKRQSMTRLILLLIFLMSIIGTSFSGFLFSGYDEDEDKLNGYSHGKDLVLKIMIIEAVVVSVFVIIAVFTIGDKPPTPPSFTSIQAREPIKTSLSSLIHNKEYILVLICFALFQGVFGSMGVTNSFEFKRFDFDSSAVSYAGIGTMIAGVIGNGIGQVLFKKYPRFKVYLFIGILGVGTGFALTLITLPLGNVALLVGVFAVLGFTSIQSFPVFYELASECGYPVSETLSIGLLSGSSSMMTFIMGTIFSGILDYDGKLPVYIVQLSSIVIFAGCLVMIKFLKIKLNRTKVDAQHEKDIVIIDEEEETQEVEHTVSLMAENSNTSSLQEKEE